MWAWSSLTVYSLLQTLKLITPIYEVEPESRAHILNRVDSGQDLVWNTTRLWTGDTNFTATWYLSEVGAQVNKGQIACSKLTITKKRGYLSSYQRDAFCVGSFCILNITHVFHPSLTCDTKGILLRGTLKCIFCILTYSVMQYLYIMRCFYIFDCIVHLCIPFCKLKVNLRFLSISLCLTLLYLYN